MTLFEKQHNRVVAIAVLLVLLAGCGDVQFATEQSSKSEGPNGDPAPTCANPLMGGADCTIPVVPKSESFVMHLTNKVDVLFVVDSSGSMANERAALGSRLANFTSGLVGLDWQICVTSTDPTREKGHLLPFTYTDLNGLKRTTNALTADIPGAGAAFLDRVVSVPSGTGDEQGIRSINLAVDIGHRDCFRSDAALATIILSDEDERSVGGHPEYGAGALPLLPENTPKYLLNNVRMKMGAEKIFTSHAIVIKSGDEACRKEQVGSGGAAYFGTWYEELSRLTGGQIGSICSTDYSRELSKFADGIRQTLDSVSLHCAPVGIPQVTMSPARPGVKITTQGNKLLFSPAVPEGTRVDVKYLCPAGT